MAVECVELEAISDLDIQFSRPPKTCMETVHISDQILLCFPLMTES